VSRQGDQQIQKIYPQCSNVFSQVRNIRFAGSLRMGGGTIFKVGGTSARQKNWNIFVIWQL